jgi:hypothetical protein
MRQLMRAMFDTAVAAADPAKIGSALSAAIVVREIGCNKINRLDLAMIFENIRLI